ncbi:hypothetical protein [Neptuniibacter sp. QD37_11]|uniref:hypothetical protein n=1 Tax=Neptuniibacter sp. QD37_11 TaxID=3398209 RepID=UPI0039F5A8FF
MSLQDHIKMFHSETERHLYALECTFENLAAPKDTHQRNLIFKDLMQVRNSLKNASAFDILPHLELVQFTCSILSTECQTPSNLLSHLEECSCDFLMDNFTNGDIHDAISEVRTELLALDESCFIASILGHFGYSINTLEKET